MKNKTLLQILNQPASDIEAATTENEPNPAPAASDSESVTAIFRHPLLQILNTYIYLAIGMELSA